MAARPIKVSIALILSTIVLGVAIRRLPMHLPAMHLPALFEKYVGSMLWALMIYLIVSATFSKWPLPSVAALSAIVAASIECFKLYHAPALDAFRLTLAGSLLLGRIFSFYDVVPYLVAIAVGAFIDGELRHRLRPTT